MSISDKKNPMFIYEGIMTKVENVAYLIPYQPLYSKGKKIFAAAVCAENGQRLLKKEFANKEEMQQWIALLNNVIHEYGVPKDFLITIEPQPVLITDLASRACEYNLSITDPPSFPNQIFG